MAYVKRTNNPNYGRPVTKARNCPINLRLSAVEMAMLEECAEKVGKSRADIIAAGIELVHKQLHK